jgi:hypothetical protein
MALDNRDYYQEKLPDGGPRRPHPRLILWLVIGVILALLIFLR